MFWCYAKWYPAGKRTSRCETAMAGMTPSCVRCAPATIRQDSMFFWQHKPLWLCRTVICRPTSWQFCISRTFSSFFLKSHQARIKPKMTQLILEKGMDKESWMKLADAENGQLDVRYITGSLNVGKHGNNGTTFAHVPLDCIKLTYQTSPRSDHLVTTMNSLSHLSQYHPSLNLMIRFGSFTAGSQPMACLSSDPALRTIQPSGRRLTPQR